MGAIIKPIGDEEDITFETKKGQSIKSSNFVKQKAVEIDTTESKNINEPRLSLEMESFLKELGGV